MLGQERARTGFDIGSGTIKMVRGEGGARLERITHAGLETFDPTDPPSALRRLLDRCKLPRRRLGRVAVSLPAHRVSVVEATVPPLSLSELRQALPFESRKHLFLDGMDDPRLDVQLLGPVESGPEHRALFAAAALRDRDILLEVLLAADIKTEVVDAEPLSLLNALLSRVSVEEGGPAIALLDIGAAHVGVQITHPVGGFLHRSLGGGVNGVAEADRKSFAGSVVRGVRETLLFYRGRNRREVEQLHVCGGGALDEEVLRVLKKDLPTEVRVFDPLPGFAAESVLGELDGAGPRLVTACGLCHWWDEPRV